MTDADLIPDRRVAEPVVPEPLVMPPSALEALMRSELDVQITTARRYPRSLALFKSTALSMIRLDQETARSCVYALIRRQRQDDGTWKRVTITGPSVRLAEIVAAAWGNLRVGARVVAETDREVVAQGYAHDLQANNAVVMEVQRRIVDRDGKRYPEELVTLTKNAASAIARRNAIFAVIPRAFITPLMEVAMKVATGDAKTLSEGRTRALAAFAELGVPAARVLEKLERPGVEDVDLEDLALLHGLLTAIKEGETSVAAEFPAPATVAEEGPRSAVLTEAVRRRRAARDAAVDQGTGAGTTPPTPSDAKPATPAADLPEGTAKS
jgi:hypothetical protein